MSIDPKNMSESIRAMLAIAIEEAALDIVGQAKLLCPVDTGRLRGSISWKTRSAESGVEGLATDADHVKHATIPDNDLEAVIGTNVRYAAPVEFGWKRVSEKGKQEYRSAAKSYLRAAVESRKKQTYEIIKRRVGEAADAISAGQARWIDKKGRAQIGADVK